MATQKNLAALAFSGTTRDSMVKRSIQVDSARKIGLDYTLREILIVVESGHSGDLLPPHLQISGGKGPNRDNLGDQRSSDNHRLLGTITGRKPVHKAV